MITVACVYWKGKFRGREHVFNLDYIIKLRNMVKRNLPMKHRFVCLSNVPVPVDRIPLCHNWEGFWSKLELFRPGLFEGRVFFLDLDVLIMQDLTPMVNFPSKFVMSATKGTPQIRNDKKRELHRYSSSVMAWDAGVPDPLFARFTKNPAYWMQYYYGDQDFISAHENLIGGIDAYPWEWANKLSDSEGFYPSEDTIVSYPFLGKQLKHIIQKTHNNRFLAKNEAVVAHFPWAREIWK